MKNNGLIVMHSVRFVRSDLAIVFLISSLLEWLVLHTLCAGYVPGHECSCVYVFDVYGPKNIMLS